MPTAVAVAVAEAVKDVIDAATLSQSFTPERNWADWEYELTELGTLRVDVVAVTTKQEVSPVNRSGTLGYTVPVDVGIRKKLTRDSTTGKITNADVDALMLLVQEIHALFTQQRLSGYLGGIWKDDPKILAAPIPKHLREFTQFTAIIRLIFHAVE